MMKRKNLFWITALLLGFSFLFMQACNDESEEPTGKGEAEFKMTDAPSDDANIEGVFVTVTDIKVDGKSIEGFNKQTIDLKAYQQGQTKLLATSEMDARTYNNLTLVLDLETDANGDQPGCYVLDTEGAKHKLKSTADGTASITVNNTWQVANNAKSSIVMDFDLRKSLTHSEGTESSYRFVGDSELNAAVRVVNEARTGRVEGTCDNSDSGAEKVIVYAYKKGTFNAETETTAQGESQILFANAVTSSEVESGISGNDTFTLAFLEEGEYELVFAGYNRDASGRLTFDATLDSEIDGSVGNVIEVKSGITLNLSTIVSIL